MPARGPYHPIAHVDDQPAVFRYFDESGRRDLSMLIVAPAQQRLHSRESIVAQAKLRLEHELQPILLNRAAQAAFEFEPIPQTAAHRGRVSDHRIRGTGLCLIHGGIGVFEYGRDIGTVFGIDGKTDARPGKELEPLVGDRLLEGGAARIGDCRREFPRRRVPQENHELIAAEAGGRQVRVRGLKAIERVRELAGDGAQDGVADRVAESVVDALEVVEIQIDDRDGLL